MTEKKYLNTTEFADLYGISPDTVRRWCRDGTIQAIKLGHNYRIDASQIHPAGATNLKGQDPWR